jgi:hypothetical protein
MKMEVKISREDLIEGLRHCISGECDNCVLNDLNECNGMESIAELCLPYVEQEKEPAPSANGTSSKVENNSQSYYNAFNQASQEKMVTELKKIQALLKSTCMKVGVQNNPANFEIGEAYGRLSVFIEGMEE